MSELCAQWRATIAGEVSASQARRAVNWSIIATLLSLIAVLGLLVTIAQTFRALREARRGNILSMKENARNTRRALAGSADTANAIKIAEENAFAAAAHVSIARETRNAQLRPYLSVNEVENEKRDWSPEGCIRLLVKNFGQTPARNIEIAHCTEFLSRPIGNFKFEDSQYRFDYMGDLAPGEFHYLTLGMGAIPNSIWNAFMSGSVLILSYRVEYEGIGIESSDKSDFTFVCYFDENGKPTVNIMNSYEKSLPSR